MNTSRVDSTVLVRPIGVKTSLTVATQKRNKNVSKPGDATRLPVSDVSQVCISVSLSVGFILTAEEQAVLDTLVGCCQDTSLGSMSTMLTRNDYEDIQFLIKYHKVVKGGSMSLENKIKWYQILLKLGGKGVDLFCAGQLSPKFIHTLLTCDTLQKINLAYCNLEGVNPDTLGRNLIKVYLLEAKNVSPQLENALEMARLI